MSLTNRLSLFFLVALAIILAVFSSMLYILVRAHLYAQLDERLLAAGHTLVAAVEVHPHDVQWEPLERRITLGEDTHADQPRWTLHDKANRLQDRSANLDPDAHRPDGLAAAGWRYYTRRMRAGNFAPEVIAGQDKLQRVQELSETPLSQANSVPLPEDRTLTSEHLVLSVAVSEKPVVEMLRWLVVVLAAVSLATWTIAALTGRWFCRRVLRPISHMAESAQVVRQDTSQVQMLEVPATHDELETLGRAFNELLADLHSAFERQRRFTGEASHQLRTPLTAMLASVEVVLRRERSAAEYQRVLNLVMRRGGQLRQIIESLLFLARMNDRTLLGQPERVDVRQWCETWLQAWCENSRAADFRFEATSTAVTSTYPALLSQVLDNLLDNACKYSEQGTPIQVTVHTNATHVCVSVTDGGWGIALEQQSLIFEPFYRTPEAHHRDKVGVGLGLAIVQQFIAILGVKLEVSSELGKGSCFCVFLPREQEDALAQVAEVRPPTVVEQTAQATQIAGL